MPPGTPLSQYLRARRSLVRPEDVGPEVLAVGGTDGQVLYVRHTEPGSPSERALDRLADMAEADPAAGRDSAALANAG